jgi:AraC-like DNA-binding protein
MEKVPAGLVNALGEATARRYGIAKPKLLAAAGLRPEDIADASTLLPAQTLFDFVRGLRSCTDDPAVGIRIGEPLDLRQHGFWGYALLSSTTFRERIEMHVRYQRLGNPFELSFAVENGTAVVSFVAHGIPADVLAVLCDFGLVSGLTHMRAHLGGDMTGVQLLLDFAELPHHAALRALLVEPIVFRAPISQLRFPAALLDRKLGGDPYLGDLARAQLDVRMEEERRAERRELPDEVRQRVRARLHRNASLETVARDLHVSARTLQRQLDAYGLSFHELLDEVRRAEALRCLSETDDGVEQIALRLGYNDASSFRRAFRRWTGLAPSEYRAESSAERKLPDPREAHAPAARPATGKGSAA